jgi:hypothetical protein
LTGLVERLDAVLLVGSLVRDEELAMGAFEPLMAVGSAAQQLRLEGLSAVRTLDLVRDLFVEPLSHQARIAP